MIRVKTAQLKARLGHYLRAVRAGREVIVQDRDTPVARLLPYHEPPVDADFVICQPRDPTAGPLGELKVRGIEYRGTDVTADLRADRDAR